MRNLCGSCGTYTEWVCQYCHEACMAELETKLNRYRSIHEESRVCRLEDRIAELEAQTVDLRNELRERAEMVHWLLEFDAGWGRTMYYVWSAMHRYWAMERGYPLEGEVE